MTVDLASTDTSQTIEPAIIANADAGQSAPLSEDATMEAVWDRLVVSNGAERENGRFVSPDPEKRAAAEAAKQAPLEGGEGGEPPVDTSTVSTEVPLPANWQGKDALWAKLPSDVKAEIAPILTEQHAKLSDMGRKVSAYEPLHNVGQQLADYMQSIAQRHEERARASGEAFTPYDGPKTPAEGIAYLFNIQQMMDQDARGTLLDIIDTYGVRDQIAAALGVKAEPGQQPDPSTRENALLEKINRLETAIRQSSDPSRIEQIIDQKTAKARHDEEVSRLASSKPLYAEIDQDDMVFFINKAWKTLGQDAAKEAVFDHAYNAAVEASPTLRAKSQAASQVAKDTAAKAEGAKRGNAVNVTSTAQGKPRVQSEDDAMEEVWRRHNKG